MELALKITGILCGVLARTLMPYLRKMKQGKIKRFKKGYILSAFASFILGLITTLLIFPKCEFKQICSGLEGEIMLFCTAFGFGFAWNSLVNETAKWSERSIK